MGFHAFLRVGCSSRLSTVAPTSSGCCLPSRSVEAVRQTPPRVKLLAVVPFAYACPSCGHGGPSLLTQPTKMDLCGLSPKTPVCFLAAPKHTNFFPPPPARVGVCRVCMLTNCVPLLVRVLPADGRQRVWCGGLSCRGLNLVKSSCVPDGATRQQQ